MYRISLSALLIHLFCSLDLKKSFQLKGNNFPFVLKKVSKWKDTQDYYILGNVTLLSHLFQTLLFSVVSAVEDLAHDWLEHNKHSRHVLGVHSFLSLTVSTLVQKKLSWFEK